VRASIRVETSPTYEVVVGPGVLEEVASFVQGYERYAVLCDRRVRELHGERLALDAPWYEVDGTEDTKSFAVLEQVLDRLADARLDRTSCLLTFGGGVLTDLGGLAASLFKRGIDVVHAPTTLLAQVDASVGGKTAVNLGAGKNLAGTFHQPKAVFCDTQVLNTLNENEWRSGLGEVVKSAWIGGDDSFRLIEEAVDALGQREADAVGTIVAECVWIKARVVAEDPLEQGARRALNLGHTFGHAIEKVSGFGRVPHGVAVAVGIVLAFEMSQELGHLRDEGQTERVRALLRRLGIPTSLNKLRSESRCVLAANELINGLAHDKKGAVGRAEFVLPRAPGELELSVLPPDGFVESFFAAR